MKRLLVIEWELNGKNFHKEFLFDEQPTFEGVIAILKAVRPEYVDPDHVKSVAKLVQLQLIVPQ